MWGEVYFYGVTDAYTARGLGPSVPNFRGSLLFMRTPFVIRQTSYVFRLDALALSVIAMATWLAGWLAVTLRYCIKTR